MVEDLKMKAVKRIVINAIDDDDIYEQYDINSVDDAITALNDQIQTCQGYIDDAEKGIELIEKIKEG